MEAPQAPENRRRRILVTYMLAVSIPILGALAVTAPRHPIAAADFIFWTLAVAIVELLPVPAWRDLRVSLAFPLLIATAILYPPPIAASIAFLGSFDPRELRGQVGLPTALFNRSQISLAVLIDGVILTALATVYSPWYVLFAATILAVVASYTANTALVTGWASIKYGLSPTAVMKELRVGSIRDFAISYLGLALLGAILATVYVHTNPLSIAFVIAPLVFARQMFFRSMALEEAHKELQDRARVMRALSDRMAEERQDERLQIAGYLHDDLAQTLFQLTLRLEMAKKRLSYGDLNAASDDLDDITAIKDKASNMIRSLVRDLHRSPIGRNGLVDALKSLADDLSRGSHVRIAVDVVQIPLPPPIQLLIFQIARQGVMNALTHAEPNTIWISLKEGQEGAELQVRDDGRGFDTSLPGPDGHFGMLMMRERATVVNGTFQVASEVGKGTTIAATFPRVWLEEQNPDESDSRPAGEEGKTTLNPDGPTGRRRVASDRGAGPRGSHMGATVDPGSTPTDQAPATRR